MQNSADLFTGIHYERTCNVRELKNPSIEEIKEYLAGNLCRCTGYMGQLRAIQKYMEVRNTAVNITVKKMGGEE